MGKHWKQWLTLFFGAPKSLQMVIAAMKLKDAWSLEEKLWPIRQPIKQQRHYFANKVPSIQGYDFPVVMYGSESWTVKKAECQRIDVFELWCWRRLLRVPWSARRSNQSILKEISLGVHWKFSSWSWNSNTLATSCKERTPLKDSDAGKDWRWKGKRTTEDEMAGWRHQTNGHEFE